MTILSRGAVLGFGAGLALLGNAAALANSADDDYRAPPPKYNPWDDPIFGPDAEENAAQHRAEKERNAKIVDKLLKRLDFLEHDGPARERKIEGRVYFYPKYARTYNYHLPYLVNKDGSSSGDSADEAALAVARAPDKEGEPLLLANEKYEVIVDYASNKRYVIDHDREIIQEEPLVVFPNRPNSILADAQKKDPEAAKRLEALFGQFTKPRLDPKREFKLVSEPNGSGKTVTINELPVTCSYHDFNMSGGKVGEVCYAPIDAAQGLSDIRDTVMEYPLPGAGKNDTLSRFRQLLEIGGSDRFPVSFKYGHSGLDGDDYDVDLKGYDEARAGQYDKYFEPPAMYKRKPTATKPK